jgi:hypothetical protein
MKDFLSVTEDFKGFVKASAFNKPADYDKRIAETIALVYNTGGMAAHRRAYLLREALTTGDFPLLFGDVIDRQLLAAYKEAPTVMRQVCRQATVPDFRNVSRYAISDGDGRLAMVGEKGEYPESDRDEARFQYHVNKYGRKFDISWEAVINDDLGALNDTPDRFARAARRTEEFFITSLFWNAAGPIDAYFAGNGGAAAVAATPLTIANLEAAIAAMARYTDASATEPIMNRPKFLVVTPNLELTARAILTSTTKMWIDQAGGGAPLAYPTTNIVPQMGLQLLVNYYIPLIVTAGTLNATTWALFSDPGEIPAAEFGLLRGHETPEVFMKAPNQTRAGGGLAGPGDGDFETDDIIYKVRHVLGGVALDGRAGWASDGQ